jgi:hypothetical protein
MKPFDLPKRNALSANEMTMPGPAANGAANDLRSYLQRSAVLRSRTVATTPESRSGTLSNGRMGPAFKSLDALLDHLRAQASECRLGVLVDLAHGAVAVSDELGIPRAPGLAELAAGRAGFEGVVHVDDETPLQIIPAGDRAVRVVTKRESERLARILDALMQVYDVVVLHAGRETALMHQHHLTGRLRAVIAVLACGGSKNADQILTELAFNCPVLSFEQSVARRWFSRRSA